MGDTRGFRDSPAIVEILQRLQTNIHQGITEVFSQTGLNWFI